MTRFWRAAVVVAGVCGGMLAQGSAAWSEDSKLGQPIVMEHVLPADGTLVVDMNVGELQIVPSPQSDHLRLELSADPRFDQKALTSWVKRFDVAASRATIEINSPNHEHCDGCPSARVVLYVPAQTALKVKLDVGDLHISGIRGNKDAQVRIGDLQIGYLAQDEYAHVVTTTHIGDVDDPLQSGDAHGFLGKSEDFTRPGRYHLRASVWIGDLRLFDEGKS